MDPKYRRIFVSDHAVVRFNERWLNKKDDCRFIAAKAFFEGEMPSQSLLKHFIHMGWSKQNYWLAVHRLYQDHLFVYIPKGNGKYLLVTLYERIGREVTYMSKGKATAKPKAKAKPSKKK